jgi:hypothetical protein
MKKNTMLNIANMIDVKITAQLKDYQMNTLIYRMKIQTTIIS